MAKNQKLQPKRKRNQQKEMISADFNKSFYDLKAVRNAVKDYKDVADFNLKDTKKSIRVILKNIGARNEELIKNEFSNYALFLSLTKKPYA